MERISFRASLTKSPSNNSVNTPRNRSSSDLSLVEQYQILTEQCVKLKLDIAEQKGKHDELHLDWQKLSSEKEAIQKEMLDVEEECMSVRDETSRFREEAADLKQKMDELSYERVNAYRSTEELRDKNDSMQKELCAAREEMELTDKEGERIRGAMWDLNCEATRISSDRSAMAKERCAIEREIENMRKEISNLSHAMEEARVLTEKYNLNLSDQKIAIETVCQQNEVLESKIAAREKKMNKQ